MEPLLRIIDSPADLIDPSADLIDMSPDASDSLSATLTGILDGATHSVNHVHPGRKPLY